MALAIWYWLILFLWLILSGGLFYRSDIYPPWIPNIFMLLLFVLLGLAAFGSPVR